MTAPKKHPASVRPADSPRQSSSAAVPAPAPQFGFSIARIRELIAELEIPFHPSLVEWRVMSTNQDGSRGQIMPYADQRAYTDRLNQLFTPAGWTRKYAVHTSANFERGEDQKVVAKVFVTCDLTIHGIGSHSATGEEWADNDNAGTSAEAQAFKRAASCFGLGRYLYYFGGTWVDLDGRGRSTETPQLFGWATPEGWRNGLRPPLRDDGQASNGTAETKPKGGKGSATKEDRDLSAEEKELVQQIEAMADAVGKTMYRGVLKSVARVWQPGDIRDADVLRKVLASMQSAERGLQRLEAASSRIGPEAVKSVLLSLSLKSLKQVDNLETLRQVVLALEDRAGQAESA